MRISFLAIGMFLLAPTSVGAQTEGVAPKTIPEPEWSMEDRGHWAFLPPTRPATPSVRNASWIRNPIDAFVLAKLEAVGLSPSPEADKETLLRRLAFDLTGLPPTVEQRREFLDDSRPDAYERLVDRLLASPHHGERWAQHWLDVARYAESNGYEADGERAHAWRYRDYVVRSFNRDRPFAEFLAEQVAGDELAAGKDPRANAELLIASGFHRCGPVHQVGGNTDADVARQEVLTEMTSAVGSTFLGLTIGCARCHHHKFDPISQHDYYRLQAFFAAAQPREVAIYDAAQAAAVAAREKELKDRIAPLRKEVAVIDNPWRDKLAKEKKAKLEPQYIEALAVAADKRTPEQKRLAADAQTLLKVTWDEILDALPPADRERRAELKSRIHECEARMPPPAAHAWTLQRDDKPVPAHLLVRGDPKRKGPVVSAAFPRVLVPSPIPSETLSRIDLARWLTRPDHPLTARVLVNRLWQHHFGRGIVETPNDFGRRGARPSHPELLDWLAVEFVSRGWSMKAMHRLMVSSSAYRQSSRPAANAAGKARDPGNVLLWRGSRQRLSGEGLRDAILAASGSLNRTLEGPMIRVPLQPEVYDLIFTEGEPDGLWHVTPDARQHDRRSLYLFAKRNVRQPLFEAFDQPDTLSPCPVRQQSTFAPQALILLNGPFATEQCRRFAARLLQLEASDSGQLVRKGYELALGRMPRAEEEKLGRDFLASQADLLRDRLRARERLALPDAIPAGVDPALAAALCDFCLALFNSNEFLYVN